MLTSGCEKSDPVNRTRRVGYVSLIGRPGSRNNSQVLVPIRVLLCHCLLLTHIRLCFLSENQKPRIKACLLW